MINKLVLIVTFLLVLAGCSNKGYDYTAFKNSRPKSILVLPPINKSIDLNAINGLYSQVTLPLSESGYYVLPVALVAETLKQNGMAVSEDAHQISISKLHEIFGADAVLYVTIEEYGTTYKVIASDTVVRVGAKLVDARTGQLLWSGFASASSAENSNYNQGGIAGLLIGAVVNQVIATATDREFTIANVASIRLLSAGCNQCILYGPRSPKYQP